MLTRNQKMHMRKFANEKKGENMTQSHIKKLVKNTNDNINRN